MLWKARVELKKQSNIYSLGMVEGDWNFNVTARGNQIIPWFQRLCAQGKSFLPNM